ncbi:MAG: hypothetical protein JW760_12555 [Spirochaetales bacterium]|nr:hypothetical protein [Spirochaetales bacterium]
MNPAQAKASYIIRLFRGYRRTALALLRLLFIIIIATALSFFIVWPLWYSAVHAPRLFSVLTLVVLPSILLILGWRKARKRGFVLKAADLRRKAGSFFAFLFCVFLFLSAVFLFLTGNPGLGTIITIGFLQFAGHLAFGRSSRT